MKKRFNLFKKIGLLLIAILSVGLLQAQQKYIETGIASFYADKFEGRKTANGEIYYHVKKTAAHQKLPFGSIVKVTNIENKKFVVVRINDRGPFIDNRIIDLSKSAASELGIVKKGLAKVELELIASTDDMPDKKLVSVANETSERYYKLNVSVEKPRGKGVQIGSYKDDENIFKIAEQLKIEYKTDVYIQIAEINNTNVYRVILGSSTDEVYLKKLKETILKKYPDCFIVTYKN
jgi:peptidoglycan lytic transglycosylase